jgi:beta-lactamase class A
MIAYYKIAENTPSFLDQPIPFAGTDRNGTEYFKSGNTIKPGGTYSIEELIQHMIGGSDNTATTVLEDAMASTTREDTYRDLGIATPSADPTAEYLSVREYAYFFRILYNATYLNRDFSERALQHLTDVDFVQGIRAGVPASVTVAQKFGERTVLNPDGSVNRRELHDCGIVYKKGANYLLCIMSRGNDFDKMAKNISDLSALVYNSITLPPSPTPN